MQYYFHVDYLQPPNLLLLQTTSTHSLLPKYMRSPSSLDEEFDSTSQLPSYDVIRRHMNQIKVKAYYQHFPHLVRRVYL